MNLFARATLALACLAVATPASAALDYYKMAAANHGSLTSDQLHADVMKNLHTAISKPDGCPGVRVDSMHLLKFVKEGSSWSEVWNVSDCKRALKLIIVFIPTPDGGTTIAITGPPKSNPRR